MTSRERVMAAIGHKEADRVPVDQGSMRSTGIMALAYNRLKAHMGIVDSPTLLYDLVQQLARPDPWYLQRFHVDAVDLGGAFESAWQPWTLPDGSAALAPAWFHADRQNGDLIVRDDGGTMIGRMPAGSIYIDQCFWPLSGPDGLDHFEPIAERMKQVIWSALRCSPFEEPITDARLDQIAATARHYYETTDYAISLSLGCSLYESAQFLFGMENFYVYLGTEGRKLAAFLDRLTELHLEFLHRLLPRLRGYVQILVMGDDLGMQTGAQISRQMYRDFFLPRHKRIYRAAKELSGAAIFMHSCGSLYTLIPDLIEAGVDILNPVQTGARNMDPQRLKREFGHDLTFWGGGCDTQGVLASGTPGEVREDVRRRLDIFMPGGGFVWNQIHNIMADVPPENVIAMLDAAHEFGCYSG